MRVMFAFGSGAVALVLGAAGCFAVVDVDRFHSVASVPDAAAGGPNQYQDLTLALVGMRPHVAQLFEYRIIDPMNLVQARGIVDPLGAADVTIHMPGAVSKLNGPFHLDFYADVDNTRNYSGIGSVVSNDHAWRIEPLEDYPPGVATPVDGLVQVTFTHNTTFTEINSYPSGTPNPSHDTGLGVTIHVDNAGDLIGDLIQARVVDVGVNHTVALYRIPAISAATFDMKISGTVENATDYKVFVYVDSNASKGTYENPAETAGDLGWVVAGTADAAGLNVFVDVSNVHAGNNDVGAP